MTAEFGPERCELIGGDFFAAVPAGADGYVLKSVIHDWDDARAIAILRTCRRAMGPEARLLVIDPVVPAGDQPSPTKILDLVMLALSPGGRERTVDEFHTLFAAAGFALLRVIPTASYFSIVEGQPSSKA
jgi:hypothetical protein